MPDTVIPGYRARFPIFAERVYMASQCLGPLLRETWRDLDEYRESLHLRSRALRPWIGWMFEVAALTEQLLHAPPHSVALRDNASSCLAALAAGLVPGPGRDRVVFTDLDFHSSRYLWQAQAQRGFVPLEVTGDGASYPVEELVKAIDERVAIVAVSLVSPRSGALLDLGPVVAAARRAGALVVLDAYQAVGIVPVDVEALDVDVLLGGNHKWLSGAAGMGLAFLYVRPGLAERTPVLYPGWVGSADLTGFPREFAPAPGARRFQQGTPAIEPIYSSRAGLRAALEVGVEALRQRSLALTEHLFAGAEARGLPTLTPRAARGGMVCFPLPNAGHEMTERLAAQGIDVDYRPDAGIRVGPHPAQTVEECERVLEALAGELARA